jgi:predicted enzyme related to lactoylglutathione lyase
MVTTNPIPTLPAADMGRASKFYEEVLGLTPDREMPGGTLYTSGTGMVLVYESEYAGTAQNTACSWLVDDVEAEVRKLQNAGVHFDTFDMPDTEWDGVIASYENLRSAWFKDTEGNILNISQEM